MTVIEPGHVLRYPIQVEILVMKGKVVAVFRDGTDRTVTAGETVRAQRFEVHERYPATIDLVSVEGKQ